MRSSAVLTALSLRPVIGFPFRACRFSTQRSSTPRLAAPLASGRLSARAVITRLSASSPRNKSRKAASTGAGFMALPSLASCRRRALNMQARLAAAQHGDSCSTQPASTCLLTTSSCVSSRAALSGRRSNVSIGVISLGAAQVASSTSSASVTLPHCSRARFSLACSAPCRAAVVTCGSTGGRLAGLADRTVQVRRMVAGMFVKS